MYMYSERVKRHEDKRCLQLEELDDDDYECECNGCGEEILKGTMRLTCEGCSYMYDLCQACGDKR